jgi:hypothetical protein
MVHHSSVDHEIDETEFRQTPKILLRAVIAIGATGICDRSLRDYIDKRPSVWNCASPFSGKGCAKFDRLGYKHMHGGRCCLSEAQIRGGANPAASE